MKEQTSCETSKELLTHSSVEHYSTWLIDSRGKYIELCNKNIHYLYAIEENSRYVVSRALLDISVATVIKFIYEEIILSLGAPNAIKSDQLMSSCKLLQIKSQRCLSYTHQLIRLLEPLHSKIECMIKQSLEDKDQTLCDGRLPESLSINNFVRPVPGVWLQSS